MIHNQTNNYFNEAAQQQEIELIVDYIKLL